MAARDIMPWVSPMGGTCSVRWGSMTASEVFEIGEPIAVVDAGTLTEPPDDATQFIVTDADSGLEIGIAAAGPGASNIDPVTGAAYATGARIPYWPIGEGNLFITKKFHAAGGTTTAVPAQTDVGENYQITYNTTAGSNLGWGVEQTAGVTGVDVVARVVEVLDVDKNPIRISSGTGVYVVFTISATLAAA